MWTYIDFGRTVRIEEAEGLIITTCEYRYCRTIVEARQLKNKFGGKLYRLIDGNRVEVA